MSCGESPVEDSCGGESRGCGGGDCSAGSCAATSPSTLSSSSCSGASASSAGGGGGGGEGAAVVSLCSKCKVKEAAGRANQTEQLCRDCLRESLFSKFKLAVSSHAMILPTDRVLVAFSDGPASRILLEFIHEMQCKAQKNLDASKERSLPVFQVGVAYVDEILVSSVSPSEADNVIKDIKSVVSSLAPPQKALHILSIGSIYSKFPESEDGTNRLNDLLEMMHDSTGKEDLLQHLRMVALQKVAVESGYDKLVLGICASRIACHVISATVKGQGYSLPADIQYVDARWEIPVVLPLYDIVLHELNTLCRLDSLKTIQKLGDSSSISINSLVSSFVAKLQVENPSRERTILRTAGKLRPFDFNKIPDKGDSNHLSSRRRHVMQKFSSSGSISSVYLCPICSGPFAATDLANMRTKIESSDMAAGPLFQASCCPSCVFQILPKEEEELEKFRLNVPKAMIRSGNSVSDRDWLRGQIDEFLLPEDDDDA